MDHKSKVIEEYLMLVQKEIHNLIPCDIFLNSLRDELYENLAEFSDCTIEDLIDEFGEPSTLAKDFLDSKDFLQPKQIAKSKKNRNIVIMFLIVALLVSGLLIIDNYRHREVMATDVITIEK